MKSLYYLFAISGFLVLVLMLEGVFVVWNSRRNPRRWRLGPSWRRAPAAVGQAPLPRRPAYSDLPALDRLIAQMPRTQRLGHFLRQAGSEMTVAMFLALSALSGLLGLLLPAAFRLPAWPGWLCAVLFTAMPGLVVRLACRRRLRKFERQWPQALDLVLQSMHAGRPFAGALERVANEVGEPVGGEFRVVCDEIGLGMPLRESLCRLARRLPSADLSYFVATVLAHEEGSEIPAEAVEKLSGLVRQRLLLSEKARAW